MAGRGAVAIMRINATERIVSAVSVLLGEDFKLPFDRRDPELNHARQLEAIAAVLERVVNQSGVYEDMTLNDLKALASERHLSLGRNPVKAGVIALLQESDKGMS